MKQKKENGEVVVEASIIVTLVVIFVSIMFYIGMILYQQSLVSIMANQTATSMSQLYSNSLKDPFTGYVDSNGAYQNITYGNLKTDAYMQVMERKANTFAFYRLKSSKILPAENTSVDVDIVKKPNSLLKSQIVVTVTDKYKIPLVSMFGVDNVITFTSVGRADCVDILEYINGVEAIGDPEKSVVPSLPNSDICLVNFYENSFGGKLISTVPVLRGKSILTSNHYSHSVMPKNPKSSKFDFVGWVLENGNGFSATYQVDNDINVYGSWECTVIFSPEGGKVNPTSKKVVVGKTTTLPTPTRDGYSFQGWFTQKEGKGIHCYSNSTVFNDNVTLYAKWQCIHQYKLVKSTAGNCKTKGHNWYKCSRCGDAYDNDGSYGSHSFGGSYCIRNATCVQKSRWRRTCSICGANDDYDGYFGEHNFGGCGKFHQLGSASYAISSHNRSNGYKLTTCGECVVCAYCGQSEYPWVWRNGQYVTRGMYCRTHNDNSGNGRADRYGVNDPCGHLHGWDH